MGAKELLLAAILDTAKVLGVLWVLFWLFAPVVAAWQTHGGRRTLIALAGIVIAITACAIVVGFGVFAMRLVF